MVPDTTKIDDTMTAPRQSGVFIWLFVVPWTVMSVGAAAIVGWQILLQLDTGIRFRQVAGVVVTSQVTTGSGKHGSNYTPTVSYSYSVDGKSYSSDRVSFETWSSSDSSFAQEFVGAHPAGKSIPVYVDPNQPATSVLRVGVQPQQLAWLLFLTPFLTVTFGLWAGVWLSRREPEPSGGLLLHERGNHVVIGSRRPHVLARAGAFVLLSSFAAGGIAFSLYRVNSSMPLMLGLYALVFGGATLEAAFLSNRNERGVFDVLVDRTARTLTFGSRVSPVVDGERAFTSVESVRIRDRSNRCSKTSDLLLTVKGAAEGRTHDVELLKTVPLDQAARGASWLCSEFGFPRGQDFAKPDPEPSGD